MIILRVFLYIICILSIGWSVLVFGGPLIVKRVILAYTNGTVSPSEITISPILDIKIGRLDYRIKKNEFELPIKGFSRSTEIAWSLFNQRPFLTVDLGPTLIEDIAVAQNIKIYTTSFRGLDWAKFFLVFETKNLELQAFGQLERLVFNGNLSRSSSKVSDLWFEAEMATINDSLNSSWLVNLISGDVAELDLNIPIYNQLLSLNFVAQQIQSDSHDLRLEQAAGSVDFFQNSKNFKIDLAEIKLPEVGGEIEKINVGGSYNEDNGFKSLKFNFLNGMFPDSLPDFSQIVANVEKSNNEKYNAFIYGDLGEFEIHNSNNFLGIMPSSNFNTQIDVNFVNSQIKAESKIDLAKHEGPEVSVLAKASFKLEAPNKLLQCYSFDCEISDLDFNVKINFDEELIEGSSKCQINSCEFSNMTHYIKTSNTLKIVEKMNQIGLLNPLSSLYVYGLINSGQKINNGHELKYQF